MPISPAITFDLLQTKSTWDRSFLFKRCKLPIRMFLIKCAYEMTTITQEKNMTQQREEIRRAAIALDADKRLLFPTDTVWSLGCLSTAEESLLQMRQFYGPKFNQDVEILVNSLEMLKDYVEELHPRLETLLVFHSRPLTLLLEQGRNLPPDLLNKDGSVNLRLVQDPFTNDLINAVGQQPIVSIPAFRPGELVPSSFGSVSSEVIRWVDYVVKFKQTGKGADKLSVKVRLSEREELLFLRE